MPHPYKTGANIFSLRSSCYVTQWQCKLLLAESGLPMLFVKHELAVPVRYQAEFGNEELGNEELCF